MGFKIGNRVRVIDASEQRDESYLKEKGVIVSCMGGAYPYWIKFDNGELNRTPYQKHGYGNYKNLNVPKGTRLSGNLFKGYQLESCKIKATKLSRKVYPKKIEKDGWLI